MSTRLGKFGGEHEIDVQETSDALVSHAHRRFTFCVDWPHLWHPGDSVAITTLDRDRYVGMVLDVSMVTKAVLIELN